LGDDSFESGLFIQVVECPGLMVEHISHIFIGARILESRKVDTTYRILIFMGHVPGGNPKINRKGSSLPVRLSLLDQPFAVSPKVKESRGSICLGSVTKMKTVDIDFAIPGIQNFAGDVHSRELFDPAMQFLWPDSL
jgi:hypothetical protein